MVEKDNISFDKDQLNRLFPFFIVIDSTMHVNEVGKSMHKLTGVNTPSLFNAFFKIERPYIANCNFEELTKNENQLFIIKHLESENLFRGQFEFIRPKNKIMFVGTPWVQNIENLKEKKLYVDDFAVSDPTFDLLHIIKNIEINSDEIKLLLGKLKDKNQLIKKSEEKYKATLEQASDIIFKTTSKGFFTYANPAAERLFGFSTQELYDISLFELVENIHKKEIKELFASQKLENKASVYSEFLVTNKNKQKIWLAVSNQMTSADGEIEYTSLGIDITDKKRVALELTKTKQQLESIFDEMQEVVWSVDYPSLKPLFISPSIQQLYGIPVKKWMDNKKWWNQSVHPEDIGVIKNIFSDMEKHGYYTHHYRIVDTNGKIKWIQNSGKYIAGEDGLPVRIDGLLMDKTKQYEAEERLNQEVRLQELLIKISLTYINIDVKQASKEINKSLEELANFVEADTAFVYDYKSNDLDIQLRQEWVKKKGAKSSFLLHENQTTQLEYHKAGSMFYVSDKKTKSLISFPLIDDGELIGFVGFEHFNKYHSYNENEQKLLFLFTQMLINLNRKQTWINQLNTQAERFKNIIANMNLGLIEVDQNEVILFANQSFCEMSGYQLKELQGKRADELFVEKDYKARLADVKNNRSRGISDSYELQVQNKAGELRWWFVSGAPNYDDKNELVGSIGIHLDITEQKQLEMDLAKAKNIAEQAAKAKELFLANMSHEIRTPLNVVIGMIRQLEKENLNEQQDYYVKRSGGAANHLLTILNDILDMAKIEAGELELDNQNFSISALANNIHSLMYSTAIEKGLNFEVEVDKALSEAHIGDPMRLRQILLNLISNAIKFTKKGSVKLLVNLLSQSEGKEEIKISVVDTGIGMTQDFANRLFEKFTQEQNTATREFQGTGLGMAISNDLIELMESQFEVITAKEKGTEINFTIKLPIGDKNELSNKNHVIKKDLFKGVNILLVEDNELNRFIAAQSMDFAGCTYDEAENGLEAIEKLKNNAYDLILMDIQMPEMDGVTAAKKIRSELKLTTPIIALTANAFKHDIDTYLASGMNDFITKPYDEQDFFIKIGKLININGGYESPQIDNKSTSIKKEIRKDDDIPLYSLNQLAMISRGDKAFEKKMLTLFVSLSEEHIQRFKEGLEKADVQLLSATAHKMKPSIDQLEIVSLKQLIRDVENAKQEEVDWEMLQKQVLEICETTHEVNRLITKIHL